MGDEEDVEERMFLRRGKEGGYGSEAGTCSAGARGLS
jgi:hypothetical protein